GWGIPPINTRAERSELATRERVKGARRGAGGAADQYASGTERAGDARASEGSQAGCRGPRRSILVRKRGFEPLRYCYRQPLKLVRLPVPPLPRGGSLEYSGQVGWSV